MNAAATHGLLVDDDPLYLRTLQRTLARRGIEAITATDISSAMQLATQTPPAFALIDLKLGSESGLNLIQPLRELRQDMRILLVTGYASIATAGGSDQARRGRLPAQAGNGADDPARAWRGGRGARPEMNRRTR